MRDLESRVKGHSRSLEMTPFDRSCMTLYSSSIVTMAVSAAILEILAFKNISGFLSRTNFKLVPN